MFLCVLNCRCEFGVAPVLPETTIRPLRGMGIVCKGSWDQKCSDRRLQVEVLMGKRALQVTGFTNAAVVYEQRVRLAIVAASVGPRGSFLLRHCGEVD